MANVLAPPRPGRPTRWRSSTGWRSCPATPAAGRRGSRCCRSAATLPADAASAAGTAGSSRPGRPTPPSGRWPRPSPPLDADRRSPTSCSPPSPTTSSSTAATPSTSPTRRSRCSTTSAGRRPRRCSPRSPPRPPAASRSEERGAWRFPHDLAGLIAHAPRPPCPSAWRPGATTASTTTTGVATLAWSILSEDPAEVVAAIDDAIAAGAAPEELGRAVAYAAALRITRFHTQNDHGDWDEVHHAFTAANALHQAIAAGARRRTLLRGRLPRRAAHLPRPVPQRPRGPPARAADRAGADLAELQACWDQEGRVDEAGAIVYRYLHGRRRPGAGRRRARAGPC